MQKALIRIIHIQIGVIVVLMTIVAVGIVDLAT